MDASLVFDGELRIPDSMGRASHDQLQGSVSENLGEVASRICYDSLGNGRSTHKLHAHILEVINLSVYEHFNFTIRMEPGEQWVDALFRAVANRKGMWIVNYEGLGPDIVDITTNYRAILEWQRHTKLTNEQSFANGVLCDVLTHYANRLAPIIFKDREPCLTEDTRMVLRESRLMDDMDLSDDQVWISLWLYGSRGFTHEQVRHRFAMSQRSTRYVDEDESDWITHPLITKYMDDPIESDTRKRLFKNQIAECIRTARATYSMANDYLTQYLLGAGMDKQTARKQGRGTARGFLGNALASEMIYSAPVSGWKWILNQRASKFADAEIRGVYEPALEALKRSRHGHRFSDYNLMASPDGMGKVLA